MVTLFTIMASRNIRRMDMISCIVPLPFDWLTGWSRECVPNKVENNPNWTSH